MIIERFTTGQRIKLFFPEDDDRVFLNGKTGKVVRLLRRSQEAWIQMDEDLPLSHRVFPVGDDRRNHICIWPDEAEVAA